MISFGNKKDSAESVWFPMYLDDLKINMGLNYFNCVYVLAFDNNVGMK